EVAETHLAPGQTEQQPDDEAEELLGESPLSVSEYIRGFSACLISTAVHVAVLVALALVAFENPLKRQIQEIISTPIAEQPEEPPVQIELNEEVVTVETQSLALLSSAPAVGAVGAGPSATVGTPTIDQQVLREADINTTMSIDFPTAGIPNPHKLIEAVPDGEVKGEPRAIVGDYQEALDRLTQEIMWMLDKGPVLVVWLFDESESMKDDQQEIRDRIQNVYRQLGISGKSQNDALLTAVSSFGQTYHSLLPRPSGDLDMIRKAIDGIPVDPSGKEMMCQAVGQSIVEYRKQAQRGRRQLALVLVSDESGEMANNDRYLEAAIAEAKAADCRIYVLGREAVFGYPHAWIRWRHDQTRRVHWLPIDRGPETGFPEQLQIDGLRRRRDAFSSGFGPYEQCRLARETNGVFFMLPSIEDNLAGLQKHRYDLEAMRPFLPDMRSRGEVLASRDERPLRTLIWTVISDLNPWNPRVGKDVELQVEFSLNPEQLVQQIRTNQQKAIALLRYMHEAQEVLEEGLALRDQEADPRWQANYDLIYAQLLAYQARIYEYGAGLEPYLKQPPTAPLTQQPNLVLVHWDVRTRSATLTKESKPYIDEANRLFQAIQKKYPGTPWAARAQWEAARGYGIHLVGDYDEPLRDVANPRPPPKL
ncbi:MAG: VWA domain-containing protein, partial [Pirellulaceae bacterium]